MYDSALTGFRFSPMFSISLNQRFNFISIQRFLLQGIYFMNSISTTSSPKILTGLFQDRESAERAYKAVAERGYSKDDISLVMTDDTHKLHFYESPTRVITEHGNKSAEGAGIGGAIGGALGAAIAAFAAVGTSLVLPGLGLVIAGPIAAALAGAGAGSVTGGVVGALIGAGLPEERVKYYEQGLKSGGILMGVTPRSEEDAKYFEQQWKANAVEQIHRE